MEISTSVRSKLRKIKGKVFFDDVTRRIYAYSASICYLMPCCVIYPIDKNDVIDVVRIAAEERIPITARGAGSGVAGQSLGEGIILDFSAFMNKIVTLNSQDKSASVEPGIIRTQFVNEIAKQNLFFPPDPSSSDYASIGGMTANNSSGSHSLLYGTTKNFIKSINVITAEGEEIVVTPAGSAPAKFDKQVKELLDVSSDIITQNWSQSYKNSCGYNLFDAIKPQGEIDLTKILCGSEGTLGLFTKIDLNLINPPKFRNSVLLCYKDTMTALSEVKDFLDLKPSTVQALADDFISIVAEADPSQVSRLPKNCAFILLVEFDGENPDELAKKAHELINRSSAFEFQFAKDAKELAWVWNIRKSAAAYLSRLPGAKPTRWIEDASVPVAKLPNFIFDLNNLLSKYNTTAALFGHAGQGLIHLSPRLDRFSPDFTEIIENLGHEHALLAKKYNGVPSGEHGDGILRTKYLPEIWSDVYPVFEKIKKIFDPNFVFNPLSIVPEKDYKIRDYLRYNQDYSQVDSGELNKFADMIEACHGCGKCKDFCPATRGVLDERSSPRAKMAILREILSGRIDNRFKNKNVDKIFNLCLHCKTCTIDCPTQIDVSKIVEAYFLEKQKRKKVDFADKMLGKPRMLGNMLKLFGKLGVIFARTKIIGIFAKFAGFRNLKLLTYSPYKNSSSSKIHQQHDINEKVAIFTGCVGEYFNAPEIQAAEKILHKININTEIITGVCCGEPAFTRGLNEQGNGMLMKSVQKLMPLYESKTPVLFSSPSCIIPFKEHTDDLVTQSQAELIKNLSYEAIHFVYDKLKENFTAENLQNVFQKTELKIAIQIPCHLRYINEHENLVELMQLATGKNIHVLRTICCGFGGSRGFEQKFAELPEKIGQKLTAEIKEFSPDVIVSPCSSCRMQIHNLLGLKAKTNNPNNLRNLLNSKIDPKSDKMLIVHPLELLAELMQ